MTLEKRFVAKVDFSTDFAYSSASLGYKKEQLATQDTFLNERLIDTVVRLSQFIEKRQYVEIYTEKGYGGWGRLKASDSLREDGRERAGLGFYAGFFHGRAKAGKDDPLVVFSFRGGNHSTTCRISECLSSGCYPCRFGS
nr:hypothetical protein [Erwinia sp. Ejp617]